MWRQWHTDCMRLPDRQLLTMTVIVTALASVVSLVTSGGDWVATLVVLPLYVTVAFWSIMLSRWISRRFTKRPEPVAPQQPTEPTTRRPGHVQRRRRRRRPRSGRGRG